MSLFLQCSLIEWVCSSVHNNRVGFSQCPACENETCMRAHKGIYERTVSRCHFCYTGVCVVNGMQAKYQHIHIYIYIYKEVMCYRGLTGIQVKEHHTEKWCRGITECRRKLWYTRREVMCYRGLTTLQVKDKTTERNHVVHKWGG